MRTKNIIYNNIAAALLQITILLFGMILPKLMIDHYGSELNGLFSSTRQLVGYLKYLELGMTSALVFTLYQPLANKKYDEINPLVAKAKAEYKKISFGYFIGVFILSIVYPLLLKESLGYTKVVALVFLVGIYGALDFYSLSKYQVLLEADQKLYVINVITILTTVLQNITTITLILLKQSIILVAFIPVVFLPIRSILLRLYVKNKYNKIDYNVAPSNVKLETRTDAFIAGLATALNISLPLIIVSIMVSLEMASVFSVYNIVFAGLTAMVSVFISGMRAAFGNMFAKGEKENILRAHNNFEVLFYMLLSVLFSSALVLIIPFVNIYIGDSADINYIYPTMAILFTVWSIALNARIPNSNIINASGNWKLTSKTNIIQIVMLLVSMIGFGYFFGVNGILIGIIIASVYKVLVINHLSNKYILKRNNKKSTLRLIRTYVVVIIVYLPFLLNIITIEANNFLKWGIWGLIVVLASSIITLLINGLFDWQVLKRIFETYVKPIFKGK